MLETDKTRPPHIKNVKAQHSKVIPQNDRREPRSPKEDDAQMIKIVLDDILGAFLSKVTDYDFTMMKVENSNTEIIGYMKRAIPKFQKVCAYKLKYDDELEEFNGKFRDEDVDEILDILSEGMVEQWLKPFLNRQDLLQNQLSTRDFTVFSPANLQTQVRETYNNAKKKYINDIREYSYNHADLRRLHA